MVQTPRTSAPVSPLLEPRSIAVIGASDQPGNLGGRVFDFLRRFKFPGQVWPVNPRRETIGGERCYPSPSDLPEVPDLAILAVSAAAAQGAVKSCIDAGIRHGILWAGGFAETGGEGVALQQALADMCREAGFKLCGPNTVGIINTWMPVTASFASSLLELKTLMPGAISIVSQSGGTAITAQALAQREGFGFRYVISSGNEAVLTNADYLRMIAADPHTKVVAMYVEGVRDPDDFLSALGEVRAAGKPVVMLKGGATEVSAAAAAAHTGALTGEDRVWRAILREFDVIPVRSLRELVDTSMFLSGSDLDRLPKGRGTAVISFGGGSAGVSADLCRRNGLTAPELTAATRQRLASLLPPGARTANPVVFTNAARRPMWLSGIGSVLDAIAADPAIDTVLFDDTYDTAAPASESEALAMAEALAAFRARTDKAVAVAWTPPGTAAHERLLAEGIFPFPDPVRIIELLGKLVGYRHRTPPPERPAAQAFDWNLHVADPRPGQVVSEHECHRILAAAGLPVARGELAQTAVAAVAAAHAVELPVAMKGISPAVTHRAAAGLLALGLSSDEAVRRGFATLSERAAARKVSLDGVYVQHMEPGTAEMIVAAFRDPMFGVMVTCGAGGTATEFLDDVVIARAPLGEDAARELLGRLRVVAAHSGQGPDPTPLAAFVSHFSRLAAAAPWRKFALEVNPVKWRRNRVVAVDGLLVIEVP